MESQVWNDVEEFFTEQLVLQEQSFSDALKRQNEEGLPPINVSPTQGKLLYLLAKMVNARDVLEIGTLGGYSTLWLAKALPDGGKVTSLEIDPKHAVISTDNIATAGLSNKVEIVVGPAKETLYEMSGKGIRTFDMIFIDADKENNPAYFEWALRFSRPGTVIVVDNVVRNGKVLGKGLDDPSVRGVRDLIDLAKREKSVESTAIQTVSGKGYDGFMVIRVKD